MHNFETAKETNDFLWSNYLLLRGQMDLEGIPDKEYKKLVKQKAKERPFRITAWLSRLSYYTTAWASWECYSTSTLEHRKWSTKCKKGESHVAMVNRVLEENGETFPQFDWFRNANAMRNLIVHYGARVVVGNKRAESKLTSAKKIFDELECFQDSYVDLQGAHLFCLYEKISEFINHTKTLWLK